MSDWLGSSFNVVVSFVDENKATLGVGAAGLALLSSAGIFPRLGFLRALTLGYRSYFQRTSPLSVRKSEIDDLTSSIRVMHKGSYIVVTGEKGNGKTCLVDSALNRHHGVVKISVS